MGRRDQLNKAMDTLFPRPSTEYVECPDCGEEHDAAWQGVATIASWFVDGCPSCGSELSLNDIERRPQKGCRVCGEPPVDGRWSYCSVRCREIANAVQEMFLWTIVRERILERDDYTCQECGLSKVQWSRAYWQVRERIDERNPYDPQENHSKWYAKQEALRDAYGVDQPYSGGYHVDHITPIAGGGHPFDEANLQTLCRNCHQAKTAEQNRGEDPDGRPADEVTIEDYLEAQTTND